MPFWLRPTSPQVLTASTSHTYQASGSRHGLDARTSQQPVRVGGAPYTTATIPSHLPRINEQFGLESFTAMVTETSVGVKAQATSLKSIASSSQTALRPRRSSFRKFADAVKGWGK